MVRDGGRRVSRAWTERPRWASSPRTLGEEETGQGATDFYAAASTRRRSRSRAARDLSLIQALLRRPQR